MLLVFECDFNILEFILVLGEYSGSMFLLFIVFLLFGFFVMRDHHPYPFWSRDTEGECNKYLILFLAHDFSA